MELTRSCIYPKDVQRITGKSERYSRKLLKKLKVKLKREQHQYVTIDEFAEYAGLDSDLVKKYITD
jgi:predicted transcriptional regulator of viral defense system